MRGELALYFFLLLVLLCGCKPNIHSREEFLKYVKDKDNGLLQEFKKSDVQTSVTYMPTPIIYNKAYKFQRDKDVKIKPSSRMCFVISLSRNGKELLNQLDLNTYSDVLQTLSFQMMSLVSLKLDNERYIAPSDCLFQQTYGLSTANELLVIFDSAEIKASKSYSLTIDEFGVGLGELKFNFLRSDIDRLNMALKI